MLETTCPPAPSADERRRLVQRIAERIGRSLERSGLITRDIENAYLALDPTEEPPIHGLLGASITYRIATGPREGQKLFTLPTRPASTGPASASDCQSGLTWAQRLKRVFAIDIDKSAGLPICTAEGRRGAVGHRGVPDETCRQCGGRLRVIATIEAPAIIDRLLAHLGRDAGAVDPAHPSCAPPRSDRLI